jgi:hypothetical protein
MCKVNIFTALQISIFMNINWKLITALVVVAMLLGAVACYLIYTTYFLPEYEVPEPILIPGKPEIVVRDTTLYDTVYVARPDPIPEPNSEYAIYTEDVTLFAGRVEFTITVRAKDLDFIQLSNQRLHLQETTYTVTDTLQKYYPHVVEVQPPFYKRFWFGFAVGAAATGTSVYLGIQAVKATQTQ